MTWALVKPGISGSLLVKASSRDHGRGGPEWTASGQLKVSEGQRFHSLSYGHEKVHVPYLNPEYNAAGMSCQSGVRRCAVSYSVDVLRCNPA